MSSGFLFYIFYQRPIVLKITNKSYTILYQIGTWPDRKRLKAHGAKTRDSEATPWGISQLQRTHLFGYYPMGLNLIPEYYPMGLLTRHYGMRCFSTVPQFHSSTVEWLVELWKGERLVHRCPQCNSLFSYSSTMVKSTVDFHIPHLI